MNTAIGIVNIEIAANLNASSQSAICAFTFAFSVFTFATDALESSAAPPTSLLISFARRCGMPAQRIPMRKLKDSLRLRAAGLTIRQISARDGTESRPAQIFVAVLVASSYTNAEATVSQQMPDWVHLPRCMHLSRRDSVHQPTVQFRISDHGETAVSSYVNRIIYESSDFVDNPEPRCPVLLLLDTSASMAGTPLAELNAGLRVLKEELTADAMAAKRVEVAVVTFGPIRVYSGFRTVDAWTPPELTPTGDTPIGAAIERGLEMLRERKQHYQAHGISQFRAWVFLITDGSPTDDCEQAAILVREAMSRKSLSFFAVGVEGANLEALAQLSPSKPLRLRGLRFRDLFSWLSRSLSSVSRSSPGDRVELASPVVPDGWGYVD